MKNAIKYIALIGSLTIVFTACSAKTEEPVEEPEANNPKAVQEQEEIDDTELPESVQGLTGNEYADIEITAVLEQMIIIPGTTIPLNINITNNGDKKIIYTQGSGSFETPQAIVMNVPVLQVILPVDYLGAATMDMQTKELLPGESIRYTLYIRAIEPHDAFNDYAYELWNNSETYIADLEWDELKDKYSDLTAAEPGIYEGHVYFLYYVDDETEENPTLSATGYASTAFIINITE